MMQMSETVQGRDVERLAADLIALGVQPGDTLFIHSSFKSLGPVEGGAGTVIAALERAVGTEGLLLMPSFNIKVNGPGARAALWRIDSTPSTVGWLTEYFRAMPGTVRSEHYSHSVAARGRGQAEFVDGHMRNEGMESPWDLAPWGRTYGICSPFVKAYEGGGKILMIGVNYESSTFAHLVEVTYWNERRRGNPAMPFVAFDRAKLGAYWDGLGRLRRGKVGDADCRLFAIHDYVDTLAAAVRREPKRWAHAWPPGFPE